MMQEEIPCYSSALPFGVGMVMGVVLGVIVGSNCCPSRRSIKKMARKTATSVGEAMDNLRESLHQYL